jgi:asparagine synthase (glutamine-hydrolysing)
MCGLAGYVGASGAERASEVVGCMVRALERRGPDSEGIARWPGAVLSHRRLAILDLSPAGHQPMLSDDGRIGVVFNGCIYNFAELRRELEQSGHRFRSNCDTEVLVRGYEQWGIDALVRRLHGMFAFAVWDNARRSLSLVRDRLGVKPLVYCARRGEIAFASTVGALRAGGFAHDLDPSAVLDFLEFGYVTEKRAIYRGLTKLPPATILTWQDGRIEQRQYWTLPAVPENGRIHFREAVEQTERLLVDAVRMRLIADVPIGVLLSGGIDSSLVCWAVRELNANITAFTVRAPDDPEDESAAAAKSARVLGIPHEVVSMPDTGADMDEMLTAFSEPFSCQSAHGMLWVSKAVKRHATVLLTGDGGDDVFLGYPFFRNAWMAQRIARALPPSASSAWQRIRGLFPDAGPARRLRSLLDYSTAGLGAYARMHNGLPFYGSFRLLGERLLALELPERAVPDSPESARRLLSDVFEYHRRMHFTSEFMTKVDGATMHYGLEARAPFLDQALWEFAAQLPASIRLHRGVLKAPLRHIAARYLGPEVAYRKKQGFTVPVERWLATRWRGMLDSLRGGTILERDGWVRPGSLARVLEQGIRREWVPVQIWHLLVLEHWLARNAPPPRIAPDPANSPLMV